MCAPTGNLEVESAHALTDGTVTGTTEFMPTLTGSSAWECFWGEVCCVYVPVCVCIPEGGVCLRVCSGSCLHFTRGAVGTLAWWESWVSASKGV